MSSMEVYSGIKALSEQYEEKIRVNSDKALRFN